MQFLHFHGNSERAVEVRNNGTVLCVSKRECQGTHLHNFWKSLDMGAQYSNRCRTLQQKKKRKKKDIGDPTGQLEWSLYVPELVCSFLGIQAA